MTFDPHITGTVDHDLVDARVGQEGVEGTEAPHTRPHPTDHLSDRLIVEEWIVIDHELRELIDIAVAVIERSTMNRLDDRDKR